MIRELSPHQNITLGHHVSIAHRDFKSTKFVGGGGVCCSYDARNPVEGYRQMKEQSFGTLIMIMELPHTVR
jgi:hypothetical protein